MFDLKETREKGREKTAPSCLIPNSFPSFTGHLRMCFKLTLTCVKSDVYISCHHLSISYEEEEATEAISYDIVVAVQSGGRWF